MLDALLWNLVLTAALAVVLTVFCHLPSLRNRPALRHWLWLLLLAKLVTPPVVGLPLLPAVAGSSNGATMAALMNMLNGHGELNSEPRADVNRADVAAASPRPVPPTHVRGNMAAVAGDRSGTALFAGLLAVSLSGTCMLLAVHGACGMKLYRWLRRAATENPRLTQSCAEVAARLNVHRTVRCCVVDARMSPLLLSWLRPLVVVPRQLIDDLSPQQLRGVVAHELAHLVRRDHWANLFVFVVKLLLWWNPVVWWADRELRAAQELCCDAIAIDRSGADRRSYASTLLKALDFIQTESAPPCPLAIAMGSRGTILRRFEMIGETRISYRVSRGTFLLLAVLAVPLVCIPVHGKDRATAPAAATDRADASNAASKQQQSGGEQAKSSDGDTPALDPKTNETVLHGRPQGKCSIAGTVVAEATGKPVANARLYLFYLPTHSAMFVNTDKDGTFIFKDVATGPYSLQTCHTAGFQDVSYDPENKGGQFPAFSLKDGEQRGGIVLTVKQACRISGKVFDENGKLPEDAKHLHVLAWFKKDDGEEYESQQASVNPSDGTFVIDGLRDKPVYVMAIDWQAAAQGHAWPPIYYPSTFSRSDAKLITFEKGPSVENVNIARRQEGGLVIAGTVRDDAGKPVPEAFVVVHRRDMLFDFGTAYTDAEGRYEMQGLGEGAFLVHVNAAHRGFVRTCAPIDLDGRTQKTQRDFTVTSGVLISGNFVDKQGNAWEIATSFGHAQVVTSESREKHGLFSLSGFDSKYAPKTVRADSCSPFNTGEGPYYGGVMLFPTRSTFIIQGMMPGHTIFEFSPHKEGQKLAEIRYDGRDIRESGIDTKPGQEIRDVTIVVEMQ